MPVTINGTTGVVTPGATIGSINGILKSSSGVVAQAVAGTDYLAVGSGGTITLATAQTSPFTAPNTYADFTGIPSWVKRITVMLNGVSTSGTSSIQIQIGSSAVVTTGYVSSTAYCGTNQGGFTATSGFLITGGGSALDNFRGIATFTTLGSNIWVTQGSVSRGDTFNWSFSGSSSALSGALDRIRITTVNGTDTFDAGTINISYE